MHLLVFGRAWRCMHSVRGMLGFVPRDDFEAYPRPEHLGLEIRSGKLPRRCLPDAKPSFTKLPECLISRQRLADAFIHLDQAVVVEPLIIHRVSRCKNAHTS